MLLGMAAFALLATATLLGTLGDAAILVALSHEHPRRPGLLQQHVDPLSPWSCRPAWLPGRLWPRPLVLPRTPGCHGWLAQPCRLCCWTRLATLLGKPAVAPNLPARWLRLLAGLVVNRQRIATLVVHLAFVAMVVGVTGSSLGHVGHKSRCVAVKPSTGRPASPLPRPEGERSCRQVRR